MLGSYRTATMIPAKDVAGTSRWYRDVLGLRLELEDPAAVTFRSGDSQLNVYQTEAAGTAQHTLIGWLVDDIEAAIDGLSARGVVFEQYDWPGLRTDAKGIADMGSERGAWFKDPEGNLLSLWQHEG